LIHSHEDSETSPTMVPNVEVSDTTCGDQRFAAGNINNQILFI